MKHTVSRPRRPLTTNFTSRTLERAIKAKRRADRQALMKGTFFMKKQFWKQPVGALTALALVVLSGASVYAAANWFNGSVAVKQDNSIMTIDLSGCEAAAMPPGVEPTSDRQAKFKILGSPHIEADELQSRLLADCEGQTVRKFYTSQYGEAFSSHFGTIKAIDTGANMVTLAYAWGGAVNEATWALQANAPIYDKGQKTSLANLAIGDKVVFTYDIDGYIEGQNPFDKVTTLKSLFKMQYDPDHALSVTKAFYTESNIMPLDHYNQLHK